MSDLLPLVAAVLNDRIANEALHELEYLRRELRISRSVQIIGTKSSGTGNGSSDDSKDSHSSSTTRTYAYAQLLDGDYCVNPKLWALDLTAETDVPTCRLADLRNCRICLGGGFLLENLNDHWPHRSLVYGYLDPHEMYDSENSKAIRFEFGTRSTCNWLLAVVNGWPSREWEEATESDQFNALDCLEYLTQTVAVQRPQATVEFKQLYIVVDEIQGFLSRWMPPSSASTIKTSMP